MMKTTPRDDGYRMPAEFAEHECCVIAWPSRASLWGPHLEGAKGDYAQVVRAVSGFEQVLVVCNPGDESEVRKHCGETNVKVEAIPIDDSWTRDSGPTIVLDRRGNRAAVGFTFNGWGGKYKPHDKDASLSAAIATVFGFPFYAAPLCTEGGAFFADGEGTLFTTVGSVLNDNRNPGATRASVEGVFRNYLNVDSIYWLEAFPDRDTDGHIDGIAQVVAGGRIALQIVEDPEDELAAYSAGNVATLTGTPDARERAIEVLPVTQVGESLVDGEVFEIPYLNFYLPNGGLIAPVGDPSNDEEALNRLSEIFPDRAVVGVPGALLSYGGGGPHCITQQIPSAANPG
ncbi:MAG TPA: agmatine deiminase family protein [Actinomycetes bacterium]|nr:agmatine deiminase family protein [Actinomycetes bacterium]